MIKRKAKEMMGESRQVWVGIKRKEILEKEGKEMKGEIIVREGRGNGKEGDIRKSAGRVMNGREHGKLRGKGK